MSVAQCATHRPHAVAPARVLPAMQAITPNLKIVRLACSVPLTRRQLVELSDDSSYHRMKVETKMTIEIMSTSTHVAAEEATRAAQSPHHASAR